MLAKTTLKYLLAKNWRSTVIGGKVAIKGMISGRGLLNNRKLNKAYLEVDGELKSTKSLTLGWQCNGLFQLQVYGCQNNFEQCHDMHVVKSKT